MAEVLAESSDLESTTIGIYRTAAVVKGGRRFSFSALVVVGDRHGRVGLGYGKAPGVPAAIEKAQKDAKKSLVRVNLQGGTLPHPVDARFGASHVRLVPAAPGTGVIAGGTARAVLDMAGVRDCLTKSFGSSNQKNLSKAVLKGLVSLKMKDDVGSARGVEMEGTVVEKLLETGQRFAPQAVEGAARAKGPVNVVGQKAGGKRGGGRGRGGGGRGRGDRGGGGGGGAPQAAEQPAAAPPAPEAPAAEAPESHQS
jgi:small subunit ribosomal protein S5